MTGRPVLSNHARQRCREMGVPTKKVKRAVKEPEVRYDSDDRDYPGCYVSLYDDIAVPHKPIRKNGERIELVLTVLWRGRAFVRPEDETVSEFIAPLSELQAAFVEQAIQEVS